MLQKYASYLIFYSSKMRSRQETVKLFILAMHDDTMRGFQWVVDKELVRHLCANGEDVGIDEMNMGLSQKCVWCNDRFILEGYMLLNNVKAIQYQSKKYFSPHFSTPQYPTLHAFLLAR
jgi:hypothetical protein